METEVLTTVLELGFGGGDDGAVDRDKGDVCVRVSVVVEVITMVLLVKPSSSSVPILDNKHQWLKNTWGWAIYLNNLRNLNSPPSTT
ncbi:hypothetical protein Tco_0307226 [Tanacetum coccineum]